MTARHANVADVPRLVALAYEEHKRSRWAPMPFEAEHVAGLMHDFIGAVGKTMFCTDGGYLAGLVQPSGFSRELMALEFAFFAVDGSGLHLLTAFETWACDMGAVALVVHDYQGNGRLATVLQRARRYELMGCALVKTLAREMVPQ